MITDPLQISYDRVAADYTAHIADELTGKPLDRALLLAFAEQVRPLGPVADLGCGPGHVAAFLADAGVAVEGIDYSSEMVAQAARRYPTLTFRQGDPRAPDVAEVSLGGMVAFYSIIHLPPDGLVPTFQAWWRALRPAGLVLVAFHIGESVRHLAEWWGHPVDLAFRFLPVTTVTEALEQAHFTILATLQRAPDPAVEHLSQRAYLLARKDVVGGDT
ncbi:MAG: class I SAM-dependent methyltransferase [Chloroflexales bacterium]